MRYAYPAANTISLMCRPKYQALSLSELHYATTIRIRSTYIPTHYVTDIRPPGRPTQPQLPRPILLRCVNSSDLALTVRH